MLNLSNYMLFFEHLYDYPGNIHNLLETLGKQLSLIAEDLNLAKMNIAINLPQLFCDRFPYTFNDTIFNTNQPTDDIPVSTDFTTEHDGLITITAYSIKGTNWTREQVKEIIFLNEQIMVLITRSRFQSQLKKAEETDNVTNVLNLAGIMHVGELLSIKKILPKFSVIALNINNFSAYNEKFGHVDGDVILKSYATGLSDYIGKDGVIGRIGADNFIIIINSSKVDELSSFLRRYQLHIELDNMTKEVIGFSSRMGVCSGDVSGYFPQLIVNAKIALKQTDPAKGYLFERYTSQ